MDASTLVDYAKSLDCIHCGLCLNACPTYRLTGMEASSPRGRIHLMRAVAEGRAQPDAAYAEELDFCLVCRGCESVCPAGVRYGEMMEFARDALPARRSLPGRFARWMGFSVLLPSRRALALAGAALRIGQRTGLVRLAAAVLGKRGAMLRNLPAVPPASARNADVPRPVEPRGEVAVLAGCVQPLLFARVHRATRRALAAAGFASRVPAEHACCGALHAHNGEMEGARKLARRTVESFDRLRGADGERLPIVVDGSGCGAHLKELGRVLEGDAEYAERARALAGRVVDLSEFLVSVGRWQGSPRAPGALRAPVAWDDPCHLCHGQQIRSQPRELLDAIDGLERVELPDSEQCCGSAGVYSFLRPQDGADVFASKLAALDRCGARTLVTANPGCQMQWEAGLRAAGRDVDVRHLSEVLADAYESSAAGGSAASSSSSRSVDAG